AVIELETGTVEIDLFEDVAPVHVNNFVFLARQGFFDGLTFHRVIENFVAQGGDPTATGTGGAGYILPDETPAPAGALSLGGAGVIAMARSAAGASSSQFFITLSPQGQLDGLDFTAFGVVTAGLDLVQGIPLRDPQEVPPPPPGARIVTVTIQE
ncbi:MAG: peptidylprolyl isomerase, partial [Chloroflexi bacterium]|nr:peptidylprolyl isomerase [Chloroflexota bacterium]